MNALRAIGVFLVVLLLGAAGASAQSGIQWSNKPEAALDRAREMDVPLMFWVTGQAEWDDDDANDLRDAQQDSFRDPAVMMIAERYFVPCRVTQNSRVLATAEQIGVDIASEIFIAIVTPAGKVLDQIDPGQVASPEALADRLAKASRAYRDGLYNAGVRELLANPHAAKESLRKAVQTVWRLRIYSADAEVAALVKRTDLTPPERTLLYTLLGTMGTPACVNALLDAAVEDKDAAKALARADIASIPTLLAALPPESGEVTPRQIAAYRAAAAVARAHDMQPDNFWAGAEPSKRGLALAQLRTRADAVHEAWFEREGRWR